MGTDQVLGQGKSKGTVGQKIKEILRFFREVTDITCLLAVALCVTVGIASVYDVIVGDDVPHIYNLGYNAPERQQAKDNTTREARGKSPDELWDVYQPTIEILDKACPEAANWIRKCHEEDRLVWSGRGGTTFANYDSVSDMITIHDILHAEPDGIKAGILAHEFRHSRQNYAKWFKWGTACMLMSHPPDGMIEDDAYYFEHRVYLAIHDKTIID